MQFGPLNKPHPPVYLITSGQTTQQTTPATEDFASILQLVRAAAAAAVDLVQLREKQLTARVLFELSQRAAEIVRGSNTKILINDRADIASAAGADGAHLTTESLPASVVRQTFGAEFLIGVSTHSLAEAESARHGGADFIVFGPVFATPSKSGHGEAQGIVALSQLASALAPFPVLALGGVTEENMESCIEAGARGVAAIGMLQEPDCLKELTRSIHGLASES